MQSNKPIILFDIDYTLFDTGKFKESKLKNYIVYEEVIDILINLSDVVSLGIFSKGDLEFQKTKLKKTDMWKFFKENNIHIYDDKDANLKKVLEKYKDSKIFLVDDKLQILYYARKHNADIFTIWVKRGPFALTQRDIAGFRPNIEVENLSEVVRIVRSELKIKN